MTRRKQPIRHPADEKDFLLDFLPPVPRLQRDGIHSYNIRYWHSILSPCAREAQVLKTVIAKNDWDSQLNGKM